MNPLLEKIHALVGDAGFLYGEEVSARATSWMDSSACSAMAIVRPANTAELSKVMAICYQSSQAVVPMGGGTGLVMGTNAGENEIIISLERINQIEQIDTQGCTVTLQAGVALQTLHQAAEQQELMFPLDLGARGSANIGGLISTNAGGSQVLRFGMMREQVLGLEAVLPDGTVISSMNEMLKNNAGYDLKQLFIGSEGTLGIITRAVLRLRPALSSRCCALAAVDNFDKIPLLLNLFTTQLGGTLNSFEVMWQTFYSLITSSNKNHQPPLTDSYPFYVLLESRGGEQLADAQRFEQTLHQAFTKELISDAVLAQNETQANTMWAIRDDIETLVQQLDPVSAFDISMPITQINNYVKEVKAKIEAQWPQQARVITFGHLGDSNIHLFTTIGTDEKEQLKKQMDIIYGELKDIGGSISAEHGVGVEKRDYLSCSRNKNEIKLMKLLKKSLDPKGLLNPGKII